MWMTKKPLEVLKEEMISEASYRIISTLRQERRAEYVEHRERHLEENRKRQDEKLEAIDRLYSVATIGFENIGGTYGATTFDFTAAQAITAILKALDMTLVKVPGEIKAQFNNKKEE
jgi:hypothetical protein